MNVPLPVERVAALDAEFGPMAVAAGGYAMELPGLTIREKCFTWIADDVCSGHLGLPFELHLQVARAAGTTWGELRAVLRHLAPYAGYPAVVEALARLGRYQGDEPDGTPSAAASAGQPPEPPGVDAEFGAWAAEQESVRWAASPLTPRERALLCLAVDVLHQTLGAPMRAHVGAALAAGAGRDTLRALLRLMSELAMGKVWQAFETLEQHLAVLDGTHR
jgi:alkylhydroperoxidase/carboxymuconolactone decarboxylase family protein YurZ